MTTSLRFGFYVLKTRINAVAYPVTEIDYASDDRQFSILIIGLKIDLLKVRWCKYTVVRTKYVELVILNVWRLCVICCLSV